LKQALPVADVALHCWYLDDGVIIARLSALQHTLEFLQSPSVRAMGLQLNLRKCSLFWPSLPDPAIIASYPADLPLLRSDRACVLGTPVGDTTFVKAALARRLPDIQAAHSLITEMDDSFHRSTAKIDMPDIDMPRLSSTCRFHISICQVFYCQVTHITIRDGTVTPRIPLPCHPHHNM
jgi:hypothetical protein